MAVSHELPILGQSRQRAMLKHLFFVIDVVHHFRLKDEEGTIDPAFANLRLFGEVRYEVPVKLEVTISGWRPYRGKCRQFAVGFVEGQELADVDICDTITPGHHHGLVAEPMGQFLDPAARA